MGGPSSEDTVAPRWLRFRTAVTLTFGARVAQAVAAFGIAAVSARELGPAGRGTVAVVLTIVTLFVQVGHLGLASAHSYYVARRPELLRAVITNSLWFAALAPIPVAAVVLLLRTWGSAVLGDIGWSALLLAVAAMPLALTVALLQGVLLGQNRLLEYNLPLSVAATGSFAALAVAATAFDLDVDTVLALSLAGWAVAAPVYLALVARGARPGLVPDVCVARRMMAYALRIYTATLVSFVLMRINLFLVNAILGASEAGQYSVAIAVGDALVLFPATVGVVLFARVASGDGAESTASVFRVLLLVHAVLCAAAAVAAPMLFPLVFGGEFDDAASVFRWLVPGVFSLGMATLLSYHFAGVGYPIEGSLHWLAGLVLNLLVTGIYLDSEGTLVAAIASSLSYTLVLLLHVHLFSRRAGGWSWLVPRRSDLAAVLGRQR